MPIVDVIEDDRPLTVVERDESDPDMLFRPLLTVEKPVPRDEATVENPALRSIDCASIFPATFPILVATDPIDEATDPIEEVTPEIEVATPEMLEATPEMLEATPPMLEATPEMLEPTELMFCEMPPRELARLFIESPRLLTEPTAPGP